MAQFFASDNCAPAHPRVLKALLGVGNDHVHSYGDDEVTETARNLMQNLCGADQEEGVEAHADFVFNGTGANLVALGTYLFPGETVLCATHAHIHEDEGGSAEAVLGTKLRLVPTVHGKLEIQTLEGAIGDIGNVHRSQPAMLSLTQTTELGTVYQPEELRILSRWAHEKGIAVHLDGARIANAVAAQIARKHPDWERLSHFELTTLGQSLLKANTVDAEIDVVCIGGSKNGLQIGETVVHFQREEGMETGVWRRNAGFSRGEYTRKHLMQLASKLRYIAVQMQEMYGTELWLTNALHANEMTKVLEKGLVELAAHYPWRNDFRIVHPAEANAIFAQLPVEIIEELQKAFFFYQMDAAKGLVRLMCSWDSRPEEIREFLELIAKLMKSLAR